MGSTKDKVQNTRLKTALADKTIQRADQTFNINNWGCRKIERKLLTDIKAKIDSLACKGKLSLTASKAMSGSFSRIGTKIWNKMPMSLRKLPKKCLLEENETTTS